MRASSSALAPWTFSTNGCLADPLVENDSSATRACSASSRSALLAEATEIAIKDLGIIPIHYQVNTWGTRAGLSYVPRTDEWTLAALAHASVLLAIVLASVGGIGTFLGPLAALAIYFATLPLAPLANALAALFLAAGLASTWYLARVEFTHIREQDRELLIRHLLRRQSDLLRERQEQDE